MQPTPDQIEAFLKQKEKTKVHNHQQYLKRKAKIDGYNEMVKQVQELTAEVNRLKAKRERATGKKVDPEMVKQVQELTAEVSRLKAREVELMKQVEETKMENVKELEREFDENERLMLYCDKLEYRLSKHEDISKIDWKTAPTEFDEL